MKSRFAITPSPPGPPTRRRLMKDPASTTISGTEARPGTQQSTAVNGGTVLRNYCSPSQLHTTATGSKSFFLTGKAPSHAKAASRPRNNSVRPRKVRTLGPACLPVCPSTDRGTERASKQRTRPPTDVRSVAPSPSAAGQRVAE